jgi:hypothetical protein
MVRKKKKKKKKKPLLSLAIAHPAPSTPVPSHQDSIKLLVCGNGREDDY